MNRDDVDAWKQWMLPYQEEAYRELDSLHWWIRKQYNLLPTDERYLNLTDGEMYVEFWLHTLAERRDRAKENGLPINSLDDLLTGSTIEDRVAKREAEIDREIEKKKQEEAERKHLETLQVEREVVKVWKADDNG